MCDFQNAYTYLEMAIKARYENTEDIIEKPSVAPIPVYDSRLECRTISDLKTIKGNRLAFQMDSLVIRERLLGIGPILQLIVCNKGAVFEWERAYDKCISLYLHALKLCQKVNIRCCHHFGSGDYPKDERQRQSEIFSIKDH